MESTVQEKSKQEFNRTIQYLNKFEIEHKILSFTSDKENSLIDTNYPKRMTLLPCPFCANKATITVNYANDKFKIGCETPGCFGNINNSNITFNNINQAILTWNTRKNPNKL